MVGDVTVYLLAGLGAQGIVIAGHEAVLIHKGDVPKGHVADDVMLHGCGLVLVDAWDMKQEGLASIFTNAHHSSREIYVSKIVLHSWDVLTLHKLVYLPQTIHTGFLTPNRSVSLNIVMF